MTASAILLELSGGVATLTFNRPGELNTLSPQLRTAFIEAVAQLETLDDLRCLVIRGAGPAFMAGGDIKGYYKRLDGDRSKLRDDLRHRIGAMNSAIVSLRNLPIPVVASVHGAVAGAGLSLMMACDLVIAADETVFTLAYSRIGVSPDCSGSFFLPRILGLRKAMEIALLGDRFDAATAHDLGLVNWVVPTAQLAGETDKLAIRLAASPTRALATTKALLNQSFDTALEAQLGAEAIGFGDCVMSDDFAEGVRAFVEKRKPIFSGS
ncbi:MAG: enoyl-CoA hydratase/isomerase family protein [Sphingomonadales bacterium]